MEGKFFEKFLPLGRQKYVKNTCSRVKLVDYSRYRRKLDIQTHIVNEKTINSYSSVSNLLCYSAK